MRMSAKPKLAKKEIPSDIPQRVAQRAYELYELRGREHGHDVDDWLRAEEEITRGDSR